MAVSLGLEFDRLRAATGDSPWQERVRAIAATAVLAVALGFIVAVTLRLLTMPGMAFADAMTYLGAGERLNAGHALYATTAGDRSVNMAGSIPLLSPPFIAVLWRPLAMLGAWTTYVWTAMGFAATLTCITAAWRARRLATAIATFALIIPLIFTADFGNVNALIMAGTVLAMRRPRWAPVLIRVMAAVKLWPLILALAFIRDRRGLILLGATLGACAAISILGAGWDNHVAYIFVVRDFPLSSYPLSLGELTGLPWLVPLVFIVGSIMALRGSYQAAIVASVLCNPATHPGSLAGLLPALAAPRTSPPSVLGPETHGRRQAPCISRDDLADAEAKPSGEAW